MDSEHSAPDFDQLADVFLRLGALQSPAQLHGYLSGLLAVGAELDVTLWPELACSYMDCRDELADDDVELLRGLLKATLAALADPELGFALLLPEDDTDIGQRAQSVAQWCLGFLAGFGLGGKQRQQAQGRRDYSAELSEMLRDIAAISQMDSAAAGEAEQGEQDLFELVEYLRISALSIYLECRESAPAAVDDESAERRLH